MQWCNYGVAWVTKCQGPRAYEVPLGPPALELKTLKIYLSAKYNCRKIFIDCVFYLMEIFYYFVVNSSNRWSYL
jgi:hypothetical protein